MGTPNYHMQYHQFDFGPPAPNIHIKSRPNRVTHPASRLVVSSISFVVCIGDCYVWGVHVVDVPTDWSNLQLVVSSLIIQHAYPLAMPAIFAQALSAVPAMRRTGAAVLSSGGL